MKRFRFFDIFIVVLLFYIADVCFCLVKQQ